jgi:hypothetical protein
MFSDCLDDLVWSMVFIFKLTAGSLGTPEMTYLSIPYLLAKRLVREVGGYRCCPVAVSERTAFRLLPHHE